MALTEPVPRAPQAGPTGANSAAQPQPKLEPVPITIKAANRLVRLWHRHARPAIGGLFAVAVRRSGASEPCGVAIVGRPCRRLQDGWTAEITRLATDGTPNACSFLIGRVRRVLQVLGYRRLTTVSRTDESGASLRGAGLGDPTPVRSGTWDRPSRRRCTRPDSAQRRLRWTEELGDQAER